ncbi:sensor histidine kinase [Rhodospira trueperi]|uniref:histidine kinase n=1 Tax=Rhodospira trueperi TaxID=69960 RepID=A0A1G6W798_9PROT|nr:ATP-binding protein [Rhodospira trueperi]SDD61694.1 Signal transduction histidine kinase [Rhodospira trueperi]
MKASWTITHWLAVVVIVAVLCSEAAVFWLVRTQEETSVLALAESRARATSEQVFEHVYTTMRHGPRPGELASIVERLNDRMEAASIRLIRGVTVEGQFGEAPSWNGVRDNDPEVARAFRTGRERVIRDGDELRFLRPLTVVEECKACHVGDIGETINGVMDIRFAMDSLKEPLGFVTGTAFMGFLGAMVIIFAALFVTVRFLVVRPIQALSDVMTQLAHADQKGGHLETPRFQVRELAGLREAFNTLMDQVSEQKAALEDRADELARAKERAEQARIQADAANVAKSEFLASMSHEIRTPLNAILGFSEVLSEEVFGPLGQQRYKTYARDIQDSGCHLRDLVNDLLDLARIESGRMELEPAALDTQAEIAACAHLFRERASERTLKLHRSCPTDIPAVTADQRALRQILNNLLSNAIKYTPPGGEVRVGARAGGGGVEIYVSDTGIGIGKDYQDLVFSAYGRVINVETRKIEGTGLGLSLVKALMDEHGGTVTLDSRPGEGATFTLFFPDDPVPRLDAATPREPA